MSIQPAKISEEAHSSNLDREPPGYLERGVQWMSRQIFHLKISTSEQLFKERLVEGINKKMVCPIVLFRQFERYVAKSQRNEIFEQLGKKRPLSYKDRMWNWIVRDASQIKQRYREIGKMMATKNPYLLAPDLIKALSTQDNGQTCQCRPSQI